MKFTFMKFYKVLLFCDCKKISSIQKPSSPTFISKHSEINILDFDFSTIIVASVDIPSGIFNLIQFVTLQAKLDREMVSFIK